MLSSVEQAFVGREEIRAPLKTPAWEATSEVDLTPVQCFLDRCFKNKYTSKHVLSVYDFLQRQDRNIFSKVSNAKGHQLLFIMPRVKPSSYNLRKETCFKPKINTRRFKNS